MLHATISISLNYKIIKTIIINSLLPSAFQDNGEVQAGMYI